MTGEYIRAIPIEAGGPVRNHCWRCGGDYNLRRVHMAYPQINATGESTPYAAYCGDCREQDRLATLLIRGEISRTECDIRWESHCARSTR